MTYRSQRIDCVVVEWGLPDMSLLEFLAQVIPRASHPETAVIVLSRLVLTSIARLATSNGAQAFLVKSRISGDELEEAIHEAIAAVGHR